VHERAQRTEVLMLSEREACLGIKLTIRLSFGDETREIQGRVTDSMCGLDGTRNPHRFSLSKARVRLETAEFFKVFGSVHIKMNGSIVH